MPQRRVWLPVLRWLLGAQVLIGALGLIGVVTFVDAHSLTVGTIQALNPAVVWQKWDALWYERIALNGYLPAGVTLQDQAAAAFFPLYPLTVRALLQLIPGASFFWTAASFSLLCTFVALLLVARDLADGLDEARRVVLVLLTSAGAFYLSIPYTEGLFLLLVVSTMVLARRGHYRAAAACAGLAAVTRVHGLALVAVPLAALWGDDRLSRRDRLIQAATAVVLFAIPFSIYLNFLARLHGSPTAFVAEQASWSNATPYPLRALVGLIEFPRRINGWLHGAYWALYVGLLVRYWRRLPLGEALFCAGALLISTQQEIFQGIYRYVTPLVPLACAIAADRSDVRLRIIAINLVFATLMILAFVTNNRLAV